jgi:probable F420-dependent oxidoreductase
MEFGIGLQWVDWRHMTSSPTLTKVARNASNMGYASLWSTDRLIARTGPPDSSEALITLASLIQVVPDMQLGVAVLVLPPRNAVIVAKQAATLSVLSGGRLLLGIGAGWHEGESRLLGSDHASRGKRMNESVEVMHRLWREDKAAFDGQFYHFEDVTMAPRPVGDGVPLWIGGNSPAAIRRAATMGDGWLPSGPDPKTLRSGMEQLQKLSSGRQMPTVAATLFVDASLSGDKDRSARAQVAGSVQQMVRILREYESAGLEHLVINFTAYDMDELTSQMRNFSQDVLPHFSG